GGGGGGEREPAAICPPLRPPPPFGYLAARLRQRWRQRLHRPPLRGEALPKQPEQERSPRRPCHHHCDGAPRPTGSRRGRRWPRCLCSSSGSAQRARKQTNVLVSSRLRRPPH